MFLTSHTTTDNPGLIQEQHLKILNKWADVVGDHMAVERKVIAKAGTAHTLILVEQPRTLGMSEQVMCGIGYLYILGIRHYAPNAFLAFPNLPNRRILLNTICES